MALAMILPLQASAQTTKMTATTLKDMRSNKTNRAVSIHDPSVFYDESGKSFYIIGSHKGLAKSTDLINFNGINTGSAGSTLYGKSQSSAFLSNPTHEVKVTRGGETTTETLGSYNAAAHCATYAESIDSWIDGIQWAPDMVYNPTMKKWCMYMSLNGDNWASVIVLLTADKPTGPFTYQAPIVFGGFNGQTYSGKSVDYKKTDLELVLGQQTSLPSRYKTTAWGNLWPNCIDPCVFFDESGELWMAYGSWSGGIFMLKLDKNTGLRDYTYTYPTKTYSGNGGKYTGYTSAPYFGKLIAGGAYVSGEGAYIEKIGDYYYLFMSYGFFSPEGGYEMRIFRSKNPDGPYTDGVSNSALYTSYVLNYGPKAGTNKGMKLLGAMNNWGTMTVGECAQGHNSAIVDPDGDAFLVYHTKFNDGTVGHLVRTRQLFQNEKQWLVASPFDYTGKQTTQGMIDTTQLFTPEEIAGTYELLQHPYRLDHNNMQEATPVKVQLSTDGKITGAKSGTWKYSQDGKSYVTLTMAGVTYYGVVMNQNVNGYKNMPALCFTAVSNSGVPVWLYKFKPQAALAVAYKEYITDYLGASTKVIEGSGAEVDNVTPTFTAVNAETKVSEPETLSESGIFTPTTDGHKITITVKATAGDYYFELGPYTRATAMAANENATPVYYPVSVSKNTTAGWWSNFSANDYTLEKGKSMEFHFYNYSNKEANYKNWCLYGASTTHGAAGYTEYFGVRNDNWDNTTGSNTGCTSDFNWDTFTSDMDGSKVDMTVNYSTAGVFTMTATITTTTSKVYNYSYTKTLTDSPASIVLFFVSEGSYIDGSGHASGIDTPVINTGKRNDGKMRNLAGQEVDESYRGIVIINGKKYVR